MLVGHPVGFAQGASLSGIDWDGVFGGEGERRDASGVLEGVLSGPRRAWSHLSNYLKSPPTYRQGEKSPSIPLLRKGEASP